MLRGRVKLEAGWGGVLSVVLVVAILGTLATLGYVISKPRAERYSEFYMLGLGGGVTGYPRQLVVGEKGQVKLGIVNREYSEETYRVEVVVGGTKTGEIGPILLKAGEMWEGVATFVPYQAGDKQEVKFLLYRQGRSEVYRELHLWIDVR